MRRGLLVIGGAFGLVLGWVDSTPGWDDSGLSAASVLLLAMLLGVIDRSRPWVWGLCAGFGIPLWGIALHQNYGSLLGLIFALAGACAGASVRKTFDSIVAFAPGPGHFHRNH
jgi:hypothetical protein